MSSSPSFLFIPPAAAPPPPNAQWADALNRSLEETDPELYDIIEHEKARQRDNIVLIASEVHILSPQEYGYAGQGTAGH